MTRYNFPQMRFLPRLLLLITLLAAALPAAADDDEAAMLLVAHPAFRDADYRQTVLLAAPIPSGGHVGVIVNRPTRSPLSALFPEHGPSKKVLEPVYIGGPFSRGALVAVVRRDSSPGQGSLQMMKNLFIAFRVNTIDQIIETTPNDARYYVGHVIWRPGQLKDEIDRGVWSVLSADPDVVFRKDMENLWEELLIQTRRIRAERKIDSSHAAAFAGAFSNVIFPAR